jgi:hypothetical protein
VSQAADDEFYHRGGMSGTSTGTTETGDECALHDVIRSQYDPLGPEHFAIPQSQVAQHETCVPVMLIGRGNDVKK